MQESAVSRVPEIVSFLNVVSAAERVLILREVIKETLRFSTAEVDILFQTIIKLEWPEWDGKTGPKVTRFVKLWECLRGRENDEISLEDFEARFVDTDNQRKNASNAIAALNVAFEKNDIFVRLEGRRSNLGTTYKLTRVLQ